MAVYQIETETEQEEKVVKLLASWFAKEFDDEEFVKLLKKTLNIKDPEPEETKQKVKKVSE